MEHQMGGLAQFGTIEGWTCAAVHRRHVWVMWWCSPPEAPQCCAHVKCGAVGAGGEWGAAGSPSPQALGCEPVTQPRNQMALAAGPAMRRNAMQASLGAGA